MITKFDTTDFFLEALHKGIEMVAEEEFERAKEDMVKRLEARKDEVVAGITINLMETVDINTMKDRLVITVRSVNDKEES